MRAKLGLGLLLLLIATSAAQAGELSLAQAEEGLKAAQGLPSRDDRGQGVLRCRVRQLEAGFRVAVAHDPRRAYLGLGRCQALLGRYGEAEGSFRKALRATPGDHAAAAELARARRLAAIAGAARPLLPKGHIVVQVAPMRAGGSEWWLALSAGRAPKKRWSNDEFYQHARLRLLRSTRHGLEQVWRSDVLRVRLGPGWTNDIRVYVLQETPPKVVVGEVCYGAGWAPAHLDAFVWEKKKLAKVFALDSDESLWIEDLNGDGRHEIGGFQQIGDGLAIADMPRWSDIYVYEGASYLRANERFPKEFLAIEAEIRQRLQERPDNWELLKYLGICCELSGDPAAALEAYRRAEAELAALAPERKAARAGLYASELADMRARIARLSG